MNQKHLDQKSRVQVVGSFLHFDMKNALTSTKSTSNEHMNTYILVNTKTHLKLIKNASFNLLLRTFKHSKSVSKIKLPHFNFSSPS